MSEDIIEDGFGSAADAVCPTCGERTVYVARPGDIRCSNCEDKALSYTGTCASCGKKFSDCGCTYRMVDGKYTLGGEHTEPGSSKPLLGESDKWEIGDLIHTIGMHYQIAKLIMEQGRGDLLPSIMEDIYYFAQALPDFFIKEKG